MELINISEPSLLIRPSRLFQEGMSDNELYEITRGVWKIGTDREKAEYAFCVANGIVQEIYPIPKMATSWHYSLCNESTEGR